MGIRDQIRRIAGSVSEKQKEKATFLLTSGSFPTFDFFFMVALSAVIATLGLVLNNVAIIIGAMLVTPLLTPLMALSLATIKGNFSLFRSALEAEAKGIAVVVLVSFIIGFMVPGAELTSEILVRTSPTLLDLMVALAAGAAGAYAIAKGINATLPGVAIATAVVPPLAVVGIGLSMKDLSVASGGALLFLANLISINFAGSVVFWALNFSRETELFKTGEVKKRLYSALVLVLLIAIPLTYIMATVYLDAQSKNTIKDVLEQQISGIVLANLAEFEITTKNGLTIVTATVISPKTISPERVEEIRFALETSLDRPIQLSMRIINVDLVTKKPIAEE